MCLCQEIVQNPGTWYNLIPKLAADGNASKANITTNLNLAKLLNVKIRSPDFCYSTVISSHQAMSGEWS